MTETATAISDDCIVADALGYCVVSGDADDGCIVASALEYCDVCGDAVEGMRNEGDCRNQNNETWAI